eukprot:173231-Lingulodinium_polyedra.AAC.1
MVANQEDLHTTGGRRDRFPILLRVIAALVAVRQCHWPAKGWRPASLAADELFGGRVSATLHEL